MLKDFELFTLCLFKENMDTVAQKLVEYSNEYNEILSKIRDNGIKIMTPDERTKIVEFYQKLINDNEFMDNLKATYRILESCKGEEQKWSDLEKNMKK